MTTETQYYLNSAIQSSYDFAQMDFVDNDYNLKKNATKQRTKKQLQL